MRKTRRFLLLVLVLAATGVALVYRDQRARQEREAPIKPEPIPQDLQSVKKDWVYYKGDGDRPVFEARAKEMEQIAGSTVVMRLKGVDLRLYKKDGKRYDHVESAAAQFDQAAGSLFAEGEVTITLAVPEENLAGVTGAAAKAPARERLLKIVTSGVHFNSADGKAQTDQPARFEFDLGSGQAVGASYDPQERDLRLAKDVKLDWIGRDPARPPMHIEANGLVYREAESKVHLLDRSRFERETLNMEGGGALITLVDGLIRNVEAGDARGTDVQPKRKLDFAAKQLKLEFNERADVEQVLGVGASRVQVYTPTATSSLTSDQLLMRFATRPKASGGGSILQDTLAQGHAQFRSLPAANSGERIVHSEAIFAKMRPNGEELEQVETRAPGVLDLMPASATQPKRHLEGSRMWIDYAASNAMETFHATDARTSTEQHPGEPGNPPAPAAITSSKELAAHFDPKTGSLTTLEQSTNFRYDEGTQHATADHAVLHQATQRIVLTGGARAWDNAGQVTAKAITMEQSSGRLIAEGDVVSTREPEAKAAPSAGRAEGPLLATGAPLHGKAARMIVSERNSVIVHEGSSLQDGKPQGRAVVWQGANRIEAGRVTINRAARTLKAEGQVTSILADAASGKGEAPKAQMTTVRADSLDYSEAERLAHYMGAVRLARPGLDVRANELRAYLSEGSNLDRMTADGQVNMVQVAADRTRKGSSEHAEYFTAGEKIMLTGGSPVMVDSLKGTTRGTKLTYTGAEDTLLVEGAPAQPASSRLRR